MQKPIRFLILSILIIAVSGCAVTNDIRVSNGEQYYCHPFPSRFNTELLKALKEEYQSANIKIVKAEFCSNQIHGTGSLVGGVLLGPLGVLAGGAIDASQTSKTMVTFVGELNGKKIEGKASTPESAPLKTDSPFWRTVARSAQPSNEKN
jgi:hypothetical protein